MVGDGWLLVVLGWDGMVDVSVCDRAHLKMLGVVDWLVGDGDWWW